MTFDKVILGRGEMFIGGGVRFLGDQAGLIALSFLFGSCDRGGFLHLLLTPTRGRPACSLARGEETN